MHNIERLMPNRDVLAGSFDFPLGRVLSALVFLWAGTLLGLLANFPSERQFGKYGGLFYVIWFASVVGPSLLCAVLLKILETVRWKVSWSITVTHICVLFLTLTLIVINNADIVGSALANDELFYAQQSVILPMMLGRLVPFTMLGLGTRASVQFLAFGAVVGSAFVVRAVLTGTKTQVSLACVGLLVLRGVCSLYVGNFGPHPPLQGLPYLVVSSVVGISDASFRFATLLTYLGFVLYLLIRLSRLIGRGYAAGAVILLTLVPLVGAYSVRVEPSVFGYMAFCVLAVEIVIGELEALHLLAIVSIATAVRLPMFIGFLPVFLLVIAEYRKGRRMPLATTLQYGTIVLFALPFILRGFLLGTPAVEGRSLVDGLRDGVQHLVTFAFARPLWTYFGAVALLVPLGIVLGLRRKLYSGAVLVGLLVAVLAVYTSISASLLGQPKYQLEMFGWFVLLGIVQVLVVVERQRAHVVVSGPVVIAAVFVLAVALMTSRDRAVYKRSADWNAGAPVNQRTYSVFYRSPVNDALALMRECGIAQGFLVGGVTYGSFPLLLAGFDQASIAQYDLLESRYAAHRTNQSILAIDVPAVTGLSDLNVLIVGEVDDRAGIIQQLDASRWRQFLSTSSGNNRLGSQVFVRPGYSGLDLCVAGGNFGGRYEGGGFATAWTSVSSRVPHAYRTSIIE